MSYPRYFFCLLAFAFVLPAQVREKRIAPVSGSDRSAFQRQGKVAIVAGVGDYPRASGLSPLRYPADDAGSLAAALEGQGYTVVILKESEATRDAIRRAVRNAGDVLDNGQGTLVFYFSGHGFAVGGRNYLATYGATALNLSQSGLALDDVEKAMRETGVERRILWIDACRNSPGKAVESQRTFAAFRAAAGERILFSTKAGRISYENDDLRHGLFTHFLLEGLRGEAAGGDGLVTFRDLADYVTAAVRAYSLKRGDVQVPYDAGEAAGDFLIAKAAGGVVKHETEKAEVVPPAAIQGFLLVSADSACTVSVDGGETVRLSANEMRRIPTTPGSHIVVMSSSERTGLAQRKIVEVRGGEQQAVLAEFGREIEQARQKEEADRQATMRREMEGLWSVTVEWEDRYTDQDHKRYRGKADRSCQINSAGEEYMAQCHEMNTYTNLDAAGSFKREYEGTFRVRRQGSQLSANAISGRRREDNGDWETLSPVFTGSLDAGGLKYEIVWKQGADGAKDSSLGTMQKH